MVDRQSLSAARTDGHHKELRTDLERSIGYPVDCDSMIFLLGLLLVALGHAYLRAFENSLVKEFGLCATPRRRRRERS